MKTEEIYEWTPEEEGHRHSSRPVFWSEYVAALEERVGPAGQNQIRVSLGLKTLPVTDPDADP